VLCAAYCLRCVTPRCQQVLLSATEAAEMILRVDDIIRCAPRQRQG
jgi:chaperonin GroEL (HSP60 family)